MCERNAIPEHTGVDRVPREQAVDAPGFDIRDPLPRQEGRFVVLIYHGITKSEKMVGAYSILDPRRDSADRGLSGFADRLARRPHWFQSQDSGRSAPSSTEVGIIRQAADSRSRCRIQRGRLIVSRLNAKGLLLFLLLLGLVGCSPIMGQEQPSFAGEAMILQAGDSLGQTFVARQGGLQGIEIFAAPQIPGTGEIRLHLRTAARSSTDLAIASIPVKTVTAPGFYRFPFPARGDSFGRAYYLHVDLLGDGKVGVGTAPGDHYLNGALYRNGNALDRQMAFRLLYEPAGLFIGLLNQFAVWLGILGLVVFLYVLPGWALLTLVGRKFNALSWAEKLGLACGLSVALYPLLFLWTDLVGLHLGSLYAWLPGLVALAVLMWRNRTWRPAVVSISFREWQRSDAFWPDLVLLSLIGIVIMVRLWVVRLLDAPMWGDSYQHAVMAQLLLDRGGLFDSWEPYTPYGTLTIHFGFPAAVSVFSWIARFQSAQATIVVGQILNALAVLTLYPLAVRLTEGNRWAGVGAVLIAGLLSPMPAFYVNWGRYSQLAGQVILPVSLWLLWETVESVQPPMKRACLAGGALAGMLLASYRMPPFYGTFVLAWLVAWGCANWRSDARRWLRNVSRLALVAGVALVFLLPWGVHISGGRVARGVVIGLTQRSTVKSVLQEMEFWKILELFLPVSLQRVALAGLIWSLVRKRWFVASLGLWVIGLASLVAGRLIYLPGSNMIQNFALIIALYIPVGLLGGWLIGEIARWAERWGTMVGRIAVGAIIIGIALYAAWNQRQLVQPQKFALVTRPDLMAMAWIREHTPVDARFLVEGARIYGGSSAVGSDAGWWIPLLAGRTSTMPPQYALNEKPLQPNYTQQVVELVKQLERDGPSSPESMRLLCDRGITHAYIGQGRLGQKKLFSPDQFAEKPAFKLVYHQDRVYIFALDARACEARK